MILDDQKLFGSSLVGKTTSYKAERSYFERSDSSAWRGDVPKPAVYCRVLVFKLVSNIRGFVDSKLPGFLLRPFGA